MVSKDHSIFLGFVLCFAINGCKNRVARVLEFPACDEKL